MKLMTIRDSRSSGSVTEMFGKIFDYIIYKDCDAAIAKELIGREHPVFVSLKLNESVNGDDDMMTMLGSVDVDTRLRISVFDTGSINNYFGSRLHSFQNFHLPGRKKEQEHTPTLHS